jgi:hypothetical protein
MKAVIQCSGTKNPSAGSFVHAGRIVKFVAQPDLHPQTDSSLVCRPDDLIPGLTRTWREHLLAYNESPENPDKLVSAGQLYTPPAYQTLLQHVGAENLFVLSAGWGLIRSDFLLPAYDITFAASADPWLRRNRRRDTFRDFNHIGDAGVEPGESVYFFGGKDYLPLYYDLTQGVQARKVVYFAAAGIPTTSGYEYIDYGKTGTNWHYRCVADFVAGRIPK